MDIFGVLKGLLHLKVKTVAVGLKRYSGVYAGGRASYHYYEDGGKRVFHGKMDYSRTYSNPPYDDGKQTAEGCFMDGRKHGSWKFTNRKHGELSELTASYIDGMLDGKCVFKSSRRGEMTLKGKGKNQLEFSMRGGRPVGAVKGMLAGCALSGCCDDDGRPDGLWVYDLTRTGSCMVNYEQWSHGKCVDAYVFDNSTGERHKPMERITEMLSNFVYHDWLSLTKIMPKGASEWDGRFDAE